MSLSWLVAMITAMPMVKPLITGSGTYRISFPKRRNPATSRISPAMKVARTKPSYP